MSTDEDANSKLEDENKKKKKVRKKRSLARRSANLILYLFITFVTLFLILIIGLHTVLKYYPEQIIGVALKESVTRGSHHQYKLNYDNIDVKLISGWSINGFLSSGSITLNNTVFEPDSLFVSINDSLPLGKKKNLIEVEAGTIALQNFSMLRAIFQEEIYIGNIFIDSAQVHIHKYKINGQRIKEKATKKTFKETLNSLFTKNKKHLKRYRIGNISTLHSALFYYDHTQKVTQQIELNELSSTFNDIYIDSITLQQQLLPIHLGTCEFNSNNIRLELKDSPIGLSFRKLSFSTLDSSLLIFNTSVYRINDEIKNFTPINNATIPLLSLEGMDINRFLFDSSIVINRFSIVKPEIELVLDQQRKNKTQKRNKTPKLPPFLKNINIKEFKLESAKIPFESQKLGKRKVNDLSFNLLNLNINNTTLKNKIPISYNYFDVKLKYQRWYLDNHHYLKVGGLYYHSKRKKLYLYSPTYKPSIAIPDSTATTFVHVQAKKITLDKVDYRFFLNSPIDSILHYDHLFIDEPKAEMWLPNHPKTVDNNKKRKDTSLTFSLNDISIQNGTFKLHQPNNKGKLTVQDIDIKLDSLSLQPNNLKNFTLGKGDLNIGDIHLPKIKNYDVLLDNVHFTTLDSSLILKGINITTDTSNNLQVNSYIKDVKISNLGWRNYIYSDSLIAQRIFIEIPSSDVELPLKKALEKINNVSLDSVNNIKKESKQPFKYLYVHDFHLRKGPLSITKEGEGLLGRSESMGIDIEGFELEKNKVDWKEIYFVVEDIYAPIKKINHKSRIDKISLNVERQTLEFEGVSLTPINETIQQPLKSLTGINNIKINGLDLRMLKDIQQFNADSIFLTGVRGVLSIDERLLKPKEKKESEKKIKEEILKHIGIGIIHLEVDDFAFLHMDKKGKESYLTFFGGEFNINQIKSIASSDKEISNIIPQDVNIKMKGLQFERDLSPYVISSSELIIDSKGDSIVITNANVTPKLGSQSIGIIDSLFLLQVSQLKLKGAGIKSIVYDKKVAIDTIYAKNINYVNPAKSKKEKKEGTFAEKNFPKTKVVQLLEQFESIAINYIEIDSSSVSLRSKAINKKKQNISRLMRRKRVETPLSNSELSQKDINKYSKKTNRIKNSKRLSKEKKEQLIDDILAETRGNPIDIYTLFATEDSIESLEHKRAFLSVYNENNIKDINLTIDGILINQNTIKSDTNYVELGQVNLDLGKNIFNLNNEMYSIGFDSLNFNSHYEDVHIKSFALIPRYSKKLFGIVNEYQTDRVDININDVLLRGFHFKEYFFKNNIHLNGLEIDRLNLSAFRDKTVPVDPNKKNPKMIHTILEGLPLTFDLDTITITDSQIDYEEFKGNIRSNNDNQELEGKSGQFQLNSFTGQIFNITNDTAKLVNSPFTEMYIKGILMDQGGQLKMYFRIPPLDSLGTYYYEGEVGRMDLVKLNPLVERLELVKIKDGNLKRMYFKVLADDSIALGNMQFRYKNLEVDVLKEKAKKTGELKRKAFLSSVANLLIREENPRFPSMKQGHIYYKRDTSKFIFNFWVKTVLTGVASTLSPLMEPDIPKKDKDSKMEIRYIEKNTKRKNRLNGPLKKIN